MKEEIRRAISFMVASQVTEKNISSIYSYSESRYTSFSGNHKQSYDYGVRAYITSTSCGLYHYGFRHYIQLKVRQNKFSGYDYGSGAHFQGEVRSGSISLYDYGERKHFSYSY